MTDKLQQAVIDAAINWWIMYRPLGWSRAHHRLKPAIGLGATDHKIKLAKAVAAYTAPRKKNTAKHPYQTSNQTAGCTICGKPEMAPAHVGL